VELKSENMTAPHRWYENCRHKT